MRKTYLILTILYTCNTADSMENSLAVSPSSSPYRSAILIGGALTVSAGIGAVLFKRYLRNTERQTSSFQNYIHNSWGAIFYKKALQFGHNAISASLRFYDAQEETSDIQGNLYSAIERNNELETRKAAKKLSPDQFSYRGRPHLQSALEKEHTPIAKILLSSGADANPLINDRSKLNGSRLMNIIATTRPCHLPILLEHSQQEALNRADNKGKTLLHTVSDIDDTTSQEAVILYIKARNLLSFNVQLKEDTYKMTPLVYAAYRNQIGVFKLLSEKSNLKIEGKDVLGIPDSDGKNCLWWAVCNGNTELVQEILKQRDPSKAIITQKDQKGISPLDGACYLKNENICTILCDKLYTECNLEEFIDIITPYMGKNHIVDDLLLSKYKNYFTLTSGYVHHIAKKDCKSAEWMKVLVKHAIPIDIVDSCYSKTTLHIAVKTGNFVLVKYLKGIINPNCQDSEGKTALHYAVIANNTRIASELLDWDATDPNVQDCKDKTALHYAGKEMKLTFENCKKVDCSIQDENGRKPNDSIFSRWRDLVLGI